MRRTTALLYLVMCGLALVAGCKDDGDSSNGRSTAGAGASANELYLVAVDRQLLSPSADRALWLVAERRGDDPASYVLEESSNGVDYQPVSAAPTGISPQAVVFELPLPGVVRYYRLAAPAPSQAVRVDPGAVSSSLAFATLTEGAIGVSLEPDLSVSPQSVAIDRYLYLVANEEGELVYLAAGSTRQHTLGLRPDHSLVSLDSLPVGGRYLAWAIGLDEDGFSVAATPRVSFETGP